MIQNKKIFQYFRKYISFVELLLLSEMFTAVLSSQQPHICAFSRYVSFKEKNETPLTVLSEYVDIDE